MKYSYENKRKCVEMYREGKWPETPEGIQERNFHKIIRKWFRIEESCGPDALRHKMQSKVWTVEEKYELVAKGSGRSMGQAVTAYCPPGSGPEECIR